MQHLLAPQTRAVEPQHKFQNLVSLSESSWLCNPAPAKDHIFSTAGKKTTNRGKHNQTLFNIHWNGQSEKKHDSEWTTVSNKKAKHRTGKGDSGTLKAAQKPVVLFISRVDPDTTQEDVEKFANIHFQKTEIHTVKSLKQDITFMPLSKLPFKVSKWKMPSAHTYGPVAY